MKPNCYECKWRRGVSGSAHSCCQHPSLGEEIDSPVLEIIAMFASVGRAPPMAISNITLNVKADPHGIKMGWFNFPWNFDPTWLDNCDGFEPLEVTE